MENENLVPNVITKYPEEILEVVFPSGISVTPGGEYTPTQLKDTPSLKWTAEPTALYILAMIDVDAPPQYSEVNHWMVGNIRGNDIETGDTIVEFMSSGPFKDTGVHRYIILVFKQPRICHFDEPYAIRSSRKFRTSFSIKKFAEKYNLENPIAGNFYRAQWDEYVDERNKNITWD